MPKESIRAEARRTGQTRYGITRGREDEQRAQNEIERKRRTAEYSHLPAPGEEYWADTDFPQASDEPHGTQGPFGPSPDPAWDYYWPTRTINPPRPRTLQARYSRRYQTLEVIFRDGTPWHYSQVPPRIWNRFKRVESPGRYINSVLNGYPYGRGGWGSIQ